jgi:hypothetical protein
VFGEGGVVAEWGEANSNIVFLEYGYCSFLCVEVSM